MTKEHRRAASSLLVLVLAAASVSHARQGRLIGKVVDTEGKPVPGVTVTTTAASIAGFRPVATTDGKGVFTVDFPRVNVLYTYTFEKAGFVTLKVEQNWTLEGTERHQFVLTPAPAGAAPAAPPASASNQAIAAYNAGVLALKAKDYKAARARFEEALAYDAYMKQAWAAQSEALLGLGEHRSAAEAAEKAMALGAGGAPLLLARWEAYRKLGDGAKAAQARADYEKVGRAADEAKRIHNEAVALVKAGDAAGAVAKFQEALAVDPGFQPAQLGLATAALEAGQAAEAAAVAETVLKADPLNEPAIRIRYNAALKLGDEALLFDALVGLASVDRALAVDSLFKLARAAYDKDDAANARKRLDKVLEVEPDNARAHYLLGLMLMREGKKGEAKAHLERFMALAPSDPDVPMARSALQYMKEH